MGSDPEHQDRPDRWLGFVILHGSILVLKSRMELNAPDTRLGLNGARFADTPVDFERAAGAADE